MQVVYHTAVRFILNQPSLLLLGKRCNACLQFKDFDAYGNDKLMQDGMKTICKECRKNPHVKTVSSQLMIASDTRICTKCLQPKKFPDDFNKMQKGEGGYHFYCKQCQSDYKRQHREENLEDYRRRQHIRNIKPTTRAYRVKRHRERSESDPAYLERRRQQGQRYYQNHVMAHRERYNRYMARKHAATIEQVNYTRILERDGWHCYICNQRIDPCAKTMSKEALEFDHVIPLAPRPGEPQGTHSEQNIKPSHKICNRRKWNKPLESLTDFDRRGP